MTFLKRSCGYLHLSILTMTAVCPFPLLSIRMEIDVVFCWQLEQYLSSTALYGSAGGGRTKLARTSLRSEVGITKACRRTRRPDTIPRTLNMASHPPNLG